METYLLKFSACLLVFWLIYILILERQKMHVFKRIYLLGAFVLALVIPLLTITHYIEPVAGDLQVASMFIPMEQSVTETPVEALPLLTLESILWIVYGISVLLFAIRFVVNLIKLYRRISKNEKVSKSSFMYVLLKDYRIPHSFFKYIFLNKTKFENGHIPQEVLLHEETHAKQWHSLDIVLVELLQIIFWFHPLIYVLKHHIKLNHEFLADQAVLNQGTEAKNYQHILLQFSSSTQDYQLSSAINYSSIKKRFTVMKTQTSKTRIWLSTLLLLPIIAILFYSFANEEYVEKDNSEIVEAIKEELQEAKKLNITYVDGATPAMMKEYNGWIKKLNTNSSSLFIPVGTWERLAAIYDLMNEEQRNSAETHPFLQEIITPNLHTVKPSKPTTAQFESWKNEKEFAIWLDGKHISNSELNRYKIDDIAYYAGSKVHDNARSEKFPQPFQFNLYTKDGFNKFYTDAYVNDYRLLTKTYSSEINTYLKGSQTDNSELRIIKAQADKLYSQFTKMVLEKYNLLPPPPVPAQKNDMQKVNKRPNQQIATKKQVAEYNAWAKKMNMAIKKAEANSKSSYPIIKQKEYKTYYNIYSHLMSDEQRNNAEAWPNIPPPPPPPPAPEPKKAKKNDGELPPPPPPPPAPEEPESTLDFVIKMAKANAKFFNEGKPISSDKAIELLKNNSKLNINAKKTKTKQPLVYITKKPIVIERKKKTKN